MSKLDCQRSTADLTARLVKNFAVGLTATMPSCRKIFINNDFNVADIGTNRTHALNCLKIGFHFIGMARTLVRVAVNRDSGSNIIFLMI